MWELPFEIVAWLVSQEGRKYIDKPLKAEKDRTYKCLSAVLSRNRAEQRWMYVRSD